MRDINYEFHPNLQKQVDLGISGTDILHGEMKNLMYEADQHLNMTVEREEQSGEAMDSMDRTYAEGYMDSLIAVNSLIIDLSYAIAERQKLTN